MLPLSSTSALAQHKKCRQDTQATGETISEELKIPLVRKSIVDAALRSHMTFHVSGLIMYAPLSDEVHNIIVARRALAIGPQTVDIGAFVRGKGKSDEGSKDKVTRTTKARLRKEGRGVRAVKSQGARTSCVSCHGKGHREADCRKMARHRR